jgi:hexokinase
MISGMYMGELVRLVLCELVDAKLLFCDTESPGSLVGQLREHGAFPTKFVSEVEEDLLAGERTFAKTFNILEDMGIEQVSLADCANVAYVCSLVRPRAHTNAHFNAYRCRRVPLTCAPPALPL